MVRVPVRVAPGLASKLYLISALPLPLVLPVVTCRKGLLLVAVQAPVASSTTESAPVVGPSTTEVVPRWPGPGGPRAPPETADGGPAPCGGCGAFGQTASGPRTARSWKGLLRRWRL